VAKGTGDVMRIAGETDAPQMMKIVEFPLHAKKGRLRRAVRDATEKLSDKASPAAPIFVEVDMVGCGKAIHPEVRGATINAELRENVIAKIPIERIFFRKMAEVLHEGSTVELLCLIRTPCSFQKV
jgi:hypothetical protein